MGALRVGVLGAGTMGHGIAQVFAQSGHAVTLRDLDQPSLERGLGAVRKSLNKLTDKGQLTPEQRDATLGRLTSTTDLAALAACDLVIEAIVEDLAAKVETFKQLDRLCTPTTILASNTSSISITKLGAATRRPEQVAGMHFMNPVPLMALVEVIRGQATSDATLEALMGWSRQLGKTPVAVNDSPGFVSNRVLMPMINEAIFAVYEGVASAEAVDQVMKLGMSHPMGPLTLADLIGLDVCLAVMDVLHQGLGDSKYRACPLLRRMVDAGWLGRKSGRGFYVYSQT
jgi:3-hydroxybutyryl-CoA dehydrogenase